MGNSCGQPCLIFFIAIESLKIPSHCFDHRCHHHKPPAKVALFVLGDSLLDPGNNNYINGSTEFQANYPPYGETFFKHTTERFSDGRLIQHFIAKFAKLPLIPSYFKANKIQLVYGVNFASGGAGVLLETNAGKVFDVEKQLSYFDKAVRELTSMLGKKEMKQLLSNAVYLISMGGKEIAIPDPIFNTFSPEEYIGILISNYTDIIKQLHNKGARKIGFINLGPLGCFPYPRANKEVVDGESDEKLMALVRSYNTAFSKKVKQLEKQLKGFQYSKLDFFTVASDMIGFKEVKTACCGRGPYRGVFSCGGKRGIEEYEVCDNVGEYLFFNSYHPNETGHQILAQQIWDGRASKPVNLKSFFEI